MLIDFAYRWRRLYTIIGGRVKGYSKNTTRGFPLLHIGEKRAIIEPGRQNFVHCTMQIRIIRISGRRFYHKIGGRVKGFFHDIFLSVAGGR